MSSSSSAATEYVLIGKDVYEHLTSEEYDDSPWTAEERERSRGKQVSTPDGRR